MVKVSSPLKEVGWLRILGVNLAICDDLSAKAGIWNLPKP